jgi:hypothetical protein
MRHQQPVLRHGTYRTLAADGDAVAYAREGEAGAAVVVLNADPHERSLAIELGALAGRRLEPIDLHGQPAPQVELVDGGSRAAVSLAGRSGAVLLAHP